MNSFKAFLLFVINSSKWLTEIKTAGIVQKFFTVVISLYNWLTELDSLV